MTDKVNLKFDQHTTASEVLDQIVRARLKQIQEGLADWNSEPDIQAACQALIDWMGNPHAQD
jgi:hypothetical protein